MPFGSDLRNEFYRLTGRTFSQETVLFTKLQDAFFNLSIYYPQYQNYIDIIHGYKGMVTFKYHGTAITSIRTGSTQKRELADMMFLVLSAENDQIRLVYLQNKKGLSPVKFKADLLQLYLLKERCEVDAVNPEVILNDSTILKGDFDSVGSYGVFYQKEGSGDIEMSYYPASCLTLKTKTGLSIQRTAYYDSSNFGQIHMVGTEYESIGERNILDFATSLVEMKIGKVLPAKSLDRTAYAYFWRKSSVFRNFLKKSSNYNIYDQNIMFEEGYEENNTLLLNMPNICIINADMKER